MLESKIFPEGHFENTATRRGSREIELFPIEMTTSVSSPASTTATAKAMVGTKTWEDLRREVCLGFSSRIQCFS